jgi:hypothetical protein
LPIKQIYHLKLDQYRRLLTYNEFPKTNIH